ncbi:hypothetical protein CT0861_05453 [Colletotrichum tofieldiae]|uniref:Uncharacterized protein n=1 Tax=Colletotrichum tofieldiae TaxID=708197 RepID=A0A166TGB9_9PEZI|nr:hypothetical protein CT0861_05453 [Colletotrichum tofieldiae]
MLRQDLRTDFTSYLLNFKGEDLDESLYNEKEAHLGDKEASTFLMFSAFFYCTTGEDIFSAPKTSKASQFVLHDLYSTDLGLANIRFRGSNAITSIETIEIKNPIRQVTYYILDTPTPFLFLLYNADKLGAYFNNVKNVIV